MCTEEDVFQVKSVEPFTTPFFCNINVGPCYLIGQPQVKYIICNGNLSASTKCKCKERYLHIDRFGNDPWRLISGVMSPNVARSVATLTLVFTLTSSFPVVLVVSELSRSAI